MIDFIKEDIADIKLLISRADIKGIDAPRIVELFSKLDSIPLVDKIVNEVKNMEDAPIVTPAVEETPVVETPAEAVETPAEEATEAPVEETPAA